MLHAPSASLIRRSPTCPQGATCENVEEMALFLLWFYTSEVAQEAAGGVTLPSPSPRLLILTL